ncbi:hypothetical protein ACE6H2_022573 [Prunus campanulata]
MVGFYSSPRLWRGEHTALSLFWFFFLSLSLCLSLSSSNQTLLKQLSLSLPKSFSL